MISYLAIPYGWNPKESFRIANEVAAKLMQEGKVIFSPVSHSHGIADYMEETLRLSQDFWMKQDLPILNLCGEIIFVVIGKHGMDLINNSLGCMAEEVRAIMNQIPISYYNYDDVQGV